MEFQSESEIRQQLAHYLTGQCTLNEFQNWFVPRSWNFKDAGDSLRNLVAQIELALAEFANGDWTDMELRQLLESALRYYEIQYPAQVKGLESKVKTASSTNARELHLTFQESPVDIRFSAAHV